MRHLKEQCVATWLLFALGSANLYARAEDAMRPDEDSAQDKKDYAQISIEDLLNKDISVAATKTRVDVAKAPVSVVALTPEDIRRSGATTLGEVLRTVAGIDVLEAFPGYISVSARGTSEAFVNNMLVLIDGRRLETQLAGVPFLEEAPLRLLDIKRIEVVKGPVGALYGTNALAGVISITTYSADDLPGTVVSLTAGNRDTYQASVREAGRLGQSAWAYKVLGGYNYTSTWGSLGAGYTAPRAAVRKADALALLERRFEDEGRLELEAGWSKGDLASLTIVTNQTQIYSYPHVRAGYSRPDFHTALTFSPQSLELREREGPVQPLIDRWSRAVNLSLDRTIRPFESSTVTLGGNVRHQRSTFTSIATPHSQMVGGVFLQDEQSLVKDRLTLFGAVGLSQHPEIPVQVDGNLAVILTPVKDHTIRASFGRGHRDPAFLESFINFRRRFGPREGYQSSNPDLDPESLDSYEMGYHGRFERGNSRFQVVAEAFRERLHNLISIVTTNVVAGTLPEFPTVTVLQQFRNVEDRRGKGFEAGASWTGPKAGVSGHYSFQAFENAATGATIQRDIPRHKLSAGLHAQKRKLEFDVWVHSVSKTVGPEGYLLVNPRVGWQGRQWGLSVQGFNVLNDRHLETANERGINGEKVGRLVTVNLAYTAGGR
jgi:iron complex outermembrane receptor protein